MLPLFLLHAWFSSGFTLSFSASFSFVLQESTRLSIFANFWVDVFLTIFKSFFFLCSTLTCNERNARTCTTGIATQHPQLLDHNERTFSSRGQACMLSCHCYGKWNFSERKANRHLFICFLCDMFLMGSMKLGLPIRHSDCVGNVVLMSSTKWPREIFQNVGHIPFQWHCWLAYGKALG